jgi:hypothetical protein
MTERKLQHLLHPPHLEANNSLAPVARAPPSSEILYRSLRTCEQSNFSLSGALPFNMTNCKSGSTRFGRHDDHAGKISGKFDLRAFSDSQFALDARAVSGLTHSHSSLLFTSLFEIPPAIFAAAQITPPLARSNHLRRRLRQASSAVSDSLEALKEYSKRTATSNTQSFPVWTGAQRLKTICRAISIINH